MLYKDLNKGKLEKGINKIDWDREFINFEMEKIKWCFSEIYPRKFKLWPSQRDNFCETLSLKIQYNDGIVCKIVKVRNKFC